MKRVVQSIVSVDLLLPPSTNEAFAARRGSHRTMRSEAYRWWQRCTKDEYGNGSKLPVLVRGKYGLWIDLPEQMRGDIDNRVKLTSDVMRMPAEGEYGLCVVVDDAHMDALYVQRGGAPPGRCVATVVTLADWPSYVEMRLL